jgi:hypothetical protein
VRALPRRNSPPSTARARRSEARVKGEIPGQRGHATVSASGGGIPSQGKFEWSRGGIGRRQATERLKRPPLVGGREAAIGDTVS